MPIREYRVYGRRFYYPKNESQENQRFVVLLGSFEVEIQGLHVLDLLAEYFENHLANNLTELVNQVLAADPNFYRDAEGVRIPTDSIRQFFIQRLNEQQQAINNLPLAPKTIQSLGNTRTTFRVIETFEHLRNLIDRDINRSRNRIFRIRLATINGQKTLVVSLNTMYLLRFLAGRMFFMAYNEEQDAEMGEAAKKKVYGLFLNILLGYRRFVSEVMQANPHPTHNRAGLLFGYFPPVDYMQVAVAGERDLLRYMRQRHSEIVGEIHDQIVQQINQFLQE